MSKMNSRWRKGAQRYSTERTVEHTRFVREPSGHFRREVDAPTETRFCDRLHQSAGWRGGARGRKAKIL